VHGDEDAVDVRALQQLAVVGVDLGNPEVPRAAAGPRLVDVAARDQLSDLAALGELADRHAGLGRVRDAEAEARVEVLRRVATAPDEADPDEAGHAARSYSGPPAPARQTAARTRSGISSDVVRVAERIWETP
jgi:hypothetical protein